MVEAYQLHSERSPMLVVAGCCCVSRAWVVPTLHTSRAVRRKLAFSWDRERPGERRPARPRITLSEDDTVGRFYSCGTERNPVWVEGFFRVSCRYSSSSRHRRRVFPTGVCLFLPTSSSCSVCGAFDSSVRSSVFRWEKKYSVDSR